METNKPKKAFNALPFYALTFLVALLFELYWILNGPADYFMLIGIGIIIVITGYLTIDSILKIRSDELSSAHQQNDTIIKAQKAIYLATKKNAMHTEKICEQNMKTLEVLIAGMVASQKELVNIITSKSESFASEQFNTNDSSDMTDLIDKLSQSNEKLAKQVQDAMTIDELVKSNAELVKNVQTIFNGTAPAANTETATEDAKMDDFDDALNSLEVEDSLMVDTLTEVEEFFDTTDDSSSEEITDDINATQTEEAQALEDMTVAEEISPEPDEDMSTTTENDERDPNAPLSEEEIAALFASL